MRAKATTGHRPEQEWLGSFFREIVMRVRNGHWLEYDPIALVVLLVGMGVVALLALSI
jgi:hypothetical protein